MHFSSRIFVLIVAAATAAGHPRSATAQDPRIGLAGGFQDAKAAARNMELVSHSNKPESFYNTSNLGDFGFLNSDMAFRGTTLVQGNFNGFQVWDISNLNSPRLRLLFPCPGGQGDPSIWGNLLFFSVEETRGRMDCGKQGIQDTVSSERFRGVRIFDISDLDHPKQVAAVQTCRGSHTHTLVEDPRDKKNIYVYVGGTAGVRSPNELAGCSGKSPDVDPNTSLFRIDIIKVPLASPQDARVIASPRVFANAGKIAGLNKGGNSGEGTQSMSETNQCHDITVYSAIGLAAGACSGNGILLDISNPAAPKRIDEVSDPNFAYWHSATFNNDGTTVLFTDEWGGGTQPKCRTTDNPSWGADAIFTRSKTSKMKLASYYKVPAPQTPEENCVAHNGSLIPIPGRDILSQGWYQGGVSIMDFTDARHPKEIAFYDRGPIDPTKMLIAGSWGAYWYNGNIYSSEIGRGLDIFRLTPSEFLSKNEIDAANTIKWETFNPQNQQKLVWPTTFSLARAYVDQLSRDSGLSTDRITRVNADLDSAERLAGSKRGMSLTALARSLDKDAKSSADAKRVGWLAKTVRDLARL